MQWCFCRLGLMLFCLGICCLTDVQIMYFLVFICMDFVVRVYVCFLFFIIIIRASLAFFLFSCLFSQEKERERRWSWVGGKVGEGLEGAGERKP